MKVYAKVVAAILFLGIFMITSTGFAAKRCKAEGKKVNCPTRTTKQLNAAADNYEKEAEDMAAGKGGSTYGIKPFDYLTGIGKVADVTKSARKANAKGEYVTESGYAKGTGKTELWARGKTFKGKTDAEKHNSWANNWSPSFSETLIPGTSPNEGKQWYYFYCIACHGWTLKGDGPNAILLDPYPRDLTAGKVYMNKKTNVELFTVIKGGGGAVGLSTSMPAWGNLLQDQDIWNVVAWIRANADRQKIQHGADLENYLHPRSSFDPKSKANAVNALNANKNDEYNDAQDELESGMAGRGVNKGSGKVVGGARYDALKAK